MLHVEVLTTCLLSTCASFHLAQMVGYYQDPEGKRIFARSDPSVLARDTNAADLQKKQTQELENGVSVIGVTCLELLHHIGIKRMF